MSVALIVGFFEETILAILAINFYWVQVGLCAGQLSVETLCIFIHPSIVFTQWQGALSS